MTSKLAQPTRRGFFAGTAATGVALCAPSLATAATKTIKIGYAGSLSGVRANFGATESWTIERMREHLADGLTLNGTTYDVELVIRDNLSEASASANVASDLVLRERCNLILVQDGDAAMAVGELADTRGVPTISTMVPWQGMFFPRGGRPDVGFPYTFHFFAGSDAVLTNFVNMFDMVETNKTVGTLFLDNPAGQGLMDPQMGMPALLEAKGYTHVPTGPFQIATNDFSNQIAQFRAAEADILSGFMYDSHFVPFWNQVAQSGLSPKACGMAAAFLFSSAVEALGDRGDGLLTEVWWTPDFPFESSVTGQSAQALAAAWEEDTGAQWTQPLGYGHALWEVGLAALARADDPLDPDSLAPAIGSLNVDTIVGPVDFAGSPVKSVAITDLVGGQWRRGTGKHAYDLKIVNNATMPQIPTDADIIPLSL
ncbi:branched-chain amino acid ABC transporter substrate-binding protein [Salipiger sp. IMCC34102]|uniref:ABC transporter substrate-binding protein n=1 Tax=Salipiger sp. IMCC34102 TaxID=2510647 RepID=UPI00101C58FC|nr:ABC transporter substrate-binding protein [Salipiger sp. IMCC34102]RYH02654.1 branched-chain amino acid ABC transporter substrate-binding protein [Salipiger sp. IMCC34102]